jgi:hypothetical protein
MNRNYIGLIVTGVVALLLIGGGVFLLLRFHGRYAEVDRQLKSQMQRHKELVSRDPYPSTENVELARRNYEELTQYADKLRTALQKEQIEPKQLEKADFPPLVERTLRQLWAAASASKVTFPEGFAFGFKKYIEGELPSRPNIPRLVVQLNTVNRLCRMLFDAKITKLTDLQRQEFDMDNEEPEEEVVDARSRRRGRRGSRAQEQEEEKDPTAAKETELYSAETFQISFTCREMALWDLLNEMARSKLFVIVTKLEVNGELQRISKISYALAQENKIRAMGGDRLTPSQQARIQRIREQGIYDPPTKEERVVAGRETIDAVLTCEVYRFKNVGAEEEETKP